MFPIYFNSQETVRSRRQAHEDTNQDSNSLTTKDLMSAIKSRKRFTPNRYTNRYASTRLLQPQSFLKMRLTFSTTIVNLYKNDRDECGSACALP